MSNELEEKFVSDDGVSTVPSPVTPEGGEAKKKLADVKKKVDPKADTVSESGELDEAETSTKSVSSGSAQHGLADKAEMKDHADYMKKKHGVTTKFHGDDELSYHGSKDSVKQAIVNHYDGDHEYAKEEHPHLFKEFYEVEEISIDESIASMFEGVDLSEDFKAKATLVFEAAVNAAATAKANEIAENLEEEFEAKLTESVNEAMEEIVENLDSYLDYVVSEWMEENTVAIEAGIKVEMAESLMEGLKSLFEEHNIDVDEETVDVISDLEEELFSVTSQANEIINENIELAKEVSVLRAEYVFNEISEGLTVSQKERLRTLSEKLDIRDLDEYASDLDTLKESFFKKKAAIIEEAFEEDEIITEETSTKKPSQYASVNAIVEALNARQS